MNDPLLENLPPITQYEICQQIYAGNKIQAIKLYRDATGCNLLNAKMAVEQIEKNLRTKNPYAFTNKSPPQNSGLKVIVSVMLLGLLLAGLAIFLASSPQTEKTTSSTTQIKNFLNETITSIGTPKLEPKPPEPEIPTTALPKQEPKQAVAVEAKKQLYVEHKNEPNVDTSPYQPLTETISTDLANLYLEKLANPAYQIWMNQPGLPRGYQDYHEEHRIKAKRAALAKNLSAPSQQAVFTIPTSSQSTLHIDGRIDKDEWQNALAVPLTPEETGSVLYLQRDADWLYLAADVPKDSTATGFDQFRFYIHVDLDPTIRNERIHVSRESEQILGGIRQTTVKWPGSTNENENERWKKYPISDWQIYRLARGAAGLNPHRQYEAKLYLKEIGLSEAAPFPAFVEIETDPIYENSHFKQRVSLGELGSQEKPLWFKMQ